MGAAVQLMGIIRTLLDPENMLASVNKSEKTDFLNHFYKHCMHGNDWIFIMMEVINDLFVNSFCGSSLVQHSWFSWQIW